jgi:hypothetical protein
MIRIISVSSLGACILFAVFTTPVHAQTALELEAAAAVDATLPPPPQGKPLDALKQRAKEIRDGAQGARVELRQETRADFKAATSSDERRGVIKDFVSDRIDIAKNRLASSTALRRDMKAAIRWHGGLIRERFAVAIRQFDKIVARIESRIDKLQAQGVATATAEAELDIAKLAIIEAKADVQAVADFVGSVEDATDRSAVKAELQALIRTAHESIKAAHAALVKTARLLVGLKADVKVNATSTATSTE